MRVVVYTRISTDEENQPTSLHSQRERLEAFCSVQEDWRIVAHHEDRSTGTRLDRPGLQAALNLARRGGADLLLVYRVDRLSRKVRQLAQLAEELDGLDVVLKSATEPFDTGSAAGRMMLQMLGVFAEFEHATIVDRITAGIERRAKQGYWPNGRVPYGYTRTRDKALVPDEREAPIVRRIFDLYTAGRLGSVSIARQLTAEGVPSRGRAWLPAKVLTILANEAYIGRVHWRAQTFDGRHEPLIDRDTFAQAGALLKQRGEDCARCVGERSDFLLTGVINCGRCHRAYVGMSARGNGGTYHYYACSGRQKLGRRACDGDRLPKDKLENAVLRQLADTYRTGTLIRQAIEQAAAHDDSERDEIEARRAGIAAEIKRAERAIERYYAAFEAGDLDAKRFDGRIAALQSQLDTLTDQHGELTHQLADDESQEPPDTRQLRAVADHLEQTLKAARPEETKALLRLLIEDLQVNSRAEILPKYKVAAQMVCAATCEVELAGLEPATSWVRSRRSPS